MGKRYEFRLYEGKSIPKQGFQVGKPKPKFEYRPIVRVGGNKQTPSQEKPILVNTRDANPFAVLAKDHEPLLERIDKQKGMASEQDFTLENEDDDLDLEEVYNESEIFMAANIGGVPKSEGASTPGLKVFNV